MFDKARNQMNNLRCGKPRAFGDQVDLTISWTSSSGKVKRTSEHFSWHGSDDPRAKIEPPSYRQYKPGGFLGVRLLNWDEIIDEDDDDEYSADSGEPSGGRDHSGDGDDNDDSDGEEDKQAGETGTGKGIRTKAGKREGKGQGKAVQEGKGKGKGNGKGKGIVKRTPAGDDISCAGAGQLQKEMYEAELDTEG